MAINGGYNILDLTSFGRISVPSTITPTADQMTNFLDPQKPTFVLVKTKITASDLDNDISGFGIKSLINGSSAITIHNITIMKSGNNFIFGTIS